MEAVYILGEIIDKGREERKDYAFCFLDIKKAYDKVDRDILWERVAEEGYGGKMLRILKEMYRDNKVSLRLGNIRTKKMNRTKGLRQGCVLSPFLFSVYINKMIKRLETSGLGIELGGKRIPLLVFADDIVLCAEDEQQLGEMLNIIWEETQELRMTISQEKSMVMRLKQGHGQGVYKHGKWQIGKTANCKNGKLEETEPNIGRANR